MAPPDDTHAVQCGDEGDSLSRLVEHPHHGYPGTPLLLCAQTEFLSSSSSNHNSTDGDWSCEGTPHGSLAVPGRPCTHLTDKATNARSFSTSEVFLLSKMSSNLLFLAGSTLYVALALRDVTNETKWNDPSHSSSSSSPSSFWSVYTLGSTLAASCYVVDAVSQVCSAPNHAIQTEICQPTIPTTVCSPLCPSDPESICTTTKTPTTTTTTTMLRLDELLCGCVTSLSSWSAGIAFGLGALLDLLSALFETLPDQRLTNWTALFAAHSYLINAILLLFVASRANRSAFAMSNSFERMGDSLFLIGSLVDVSLSYCYFGGKSDAVWKNVYLGNLVTSVLWLVDSFLYIAADLLSNQQSQTVDDESTQRMNSFSSQNSSSSNENELDMERQTLKLSVVASSTSAMDDERPMTRSLSCTLHNDCDDRHLLAALQDDDDDDADGKYTLFYS